MFLDLGRVEVMAEVKVNGKELSILWSRPYQVDITDAVKAGSNYTGSTGNQHVAQPPDW